MGRALLRLWRFSRVLLRGPTRPARTRQVRPTTRRRDFQRARVYRWEAEHIFPLAADRLSLEQCRALVDQAFRWREAPNMSRNWTPPAVTDGRGRRHACGSRAAIKLPRWSRTRAVVLHECAHGMADDQHGPVFVAEYVDLLERFAKLDRAHLLATLAAAGVSIEPGGS